MVSIRMGNMSKPDKKDPAAPPPSPQQIPEGKSPKEIGGREGLDPVRYGDWEVGGKCVDF